jgi:hypothetical protein
MGCPSTHSHLITVRLKLQRISSWIWKAELANGNASAAGHN